MTVQSLSAAQVKVGDSLPSLSFDVTVTSNVNWSPGRSGWSSITRVDTVMVSSTIDVIDESVATTTR